MKDKSSKAKPIKGKEEMKAKTSKTEDNTNITVIKPKEKAVIKPKDKALTLTKPKAVKLPVSDDFVMTLSDDEGEEVMSEESDNEDKDKSQENKKPKVMNIDFSFQDDSMYYEEEAAAQGNWDFTAASKADNRKVTTLKDKVEKVRKDKAIVMSDSEEEDEDMGEVEVGGEEGEEKDGEDEDGVGQIGSGREEIIEEDDQDIELDENEIKRREIAAAYFEEETEAQKQSSTNIPTFQALHLSRPLLRSVSEMGFVTPTPIQARCIPKVLAGRDLVAGAQTGSGKTAAFLLPTLERLLFRSKKISSSRVLIITPTRELATQCHQMCTKLMQYTDVSACLVVGGLSIKSQEVDLRGKPDIIICTPGRMIDHVRNTQGVELDHIEVLILDEADRLLEMGFTDEITELVKFCPIGRQTLLFSATMTDKVDELIKLSLNKPVRIRVNAADHVVDRLSQEFIRIRENREEDREAILLSLVTRNFKKQTIIFFEEKAMTHRMCIVFGLVGLSSAELHGNMTQRQRLEALQLFRDGKVDFLLCTELAARGLDVKGCTTVINFHMPREMNRYIHRVGRTARAGRSGKALTLVGERGRNLLREIVKNSTSNIKSRQVPVNIITKWKKRITDLEASVQEVYSAEREEKQIRMADMEATKAQNLLLHADEIASRPARTWFQSQKDKEDIKKATMEALHIQNPYNNNTTDEEKDKKKKRKREEEEERREKTEHGMSRKKRRRLEALKVIDDEMGGGGEEEEGGKKKRVTEKQQKELTKKAMIKNEISQKKSARVKKEAAMKFRNETGGDLFKEEQMKERSEKRKKKKAIKKGSGAFDVDMNTSTTSSKFSKNSKSASSPGEKKPFNKGGDKDKGKFKLKAKSAFKSKSRYKRK